MGLQRLRAARRTQTAVARGLGQRDAGGHDDRHHRDSLRQARQDVDAVSGSWFNRAFRHAVWRFLA